MQLCIASVLIQDGHEQHLNNLKKVRNITRAYLIIEKLKEGYKIGFSWLIKLIIKFYTLYLVNYKNMADFSS